MSRHRDDPIVAVATAAGRGGIGIVRVSFGAWTGTPVVGEFIATICGRSREWSLAPRVATMIAIRDARGAAIDRGIGLFFAAPATYTAEDVVEWQLHGGPVVLRMVVERCLAVADDVRRERALTVAMRPAEPGEFTERAFLHGQLDLAQAEAVADLIDASSEAAARGAQASLSGAFSRAVRAVVDDVIGLRALVEATLDFPDEEIDFLEASDARGRLAAIRAALDDLQARARRGAILREGLTVVLVGRPNVGKSSLLNALAEADVAIVTPVAGTTRDRIEQTIRLGDVVIHAVDTAGIRETGDGDADAIERLGIARTWEAVERAHVVLHVVEATSPRTDDPDGDDPDDAAIAARLPATAERRTVVNKIDLTGEPPSVVPGDVVRLSAKDGRGVDGLRDELLAIAGWRPGAETDFLARERHLTAIRAAVAHVATAAQHAEEGDRQLDLFAEELRLAQRELDRITGAFSADDLLGEIFGRFCIGK